MVSYAKFNYKTASLASDFGFDLAVKWFGDKAINELPKFKKGKKVGKTKGSIVWKKVFKGGWVRTGSYDFDSGTADGYVEQRVNQIIGKCLLIEVWGGSPDTHLEAQELIKGLKNEVMTLATKFKVTTTTPEPTVTTPTETNDGELDRNDRGNVTWAYEMLLRGQKDEAKKMLHKVVGDFIKDRKAGK